MTRRIGLFGGTFDPPHMAHLVVAEQVKTQLELDRVVFVVAHVPWQKVGSRQITRSVDRLALTELAIAGREGFETSAVEIERGGDSYTIDTLETLRADANDDDDEFVVIVGSDTAAQLHTWHRADELRSMTSFAVVRRPGDHGDAPSGWQTAPVDMPALDVSSTALRSMVAAGRSIRFLTPDAVVHRVDELGLYRPSP